MTDLTKYVDDGISADELRDLLNGNAPVLDRVTVREFLILRAGYLPPGSSPVALFEVMTDAVMELLGEAPRSDKV